VAAAVTASGWCPEEKNLGKRDCLGEEDLAARECIRVLLTMNLGIFNLDEINPDKSQRF